MEITVAELGIQPDEIISRIYQGCDITIIHNGKACARIIPLEDETIESNNSANELFGLWKDRSETSDVNAYVRMMRQGRKL